MHSQRTDTYVYFVCYILMPLLVHTYGHCALGSSEPTVPKWIQAEKIRAGYSGPAPESLLRRLRDAGFNTFMLKLGTFEDQGDVLRKYALLCKRIGLRLFVIVNTSGEYERRMFMEPLRKQVDKFGTQLRGCCPLESRFWERVFLNRAREALRITDGAIDAFVLDPEAYTPNVASSPLDAVCFCDECFQRACRDLELPLTPRIPPEQRYVKLVATARIDEYNDWLRKQLESILKPMVKRLHDIKSNLLFGNFLYQPSWFHMALVRAFSSNGTPALIFRERTYVGNLVNVEEAREHFSKINAVVIDIGGTWLGRLMPNEQAAHAYALATSINGYWVFDIGALLRKAGEGDPRSAYYLPRPADEYLQWFKRANDDITEHIRNPKFVSTLKWSPQSYISIPPPLGSLSISTIATLQKFKPLAQLHPQAIMLKGFKPSSGPTRIRTEGVVAFYARAGEEIRFTVHALQIGNYRYVTSYVLFSPSGEVIAQKQIPPKQSQEVKVTATEEGVYALVALCHANAFAVSTQHRYFGYIVSGRGLSIVSHARRLFFYVPKGMRRFKLHVSPGGGVEHCDLEIYNPNGSVMKRIALASGAIEVTVPEGQDGKCWSFKLLPPSKKGFVFEDVTVHLNAKIPPILSPSPEALIIAPR